jgi:chromosome segregation ATPase
MPELEKRLGLLRLLLADIESKRAQLAQMEAQYRAQLSRIVDFVVYREGDVANALSLMSEVQSKLDEVVQTTVHLGMLESRAITERDVLTLTKQVTEARSQLSELEERQRELSSRQEHLSGHMGEAGSDADRPLEDIRAVQMEVADVQGEMARLNDLINEASERAARMIQAATRER